MSVRRFRLPALLLASSLGLGACAYGYGDGYGYGSVGYGHDGYCDPYYDDCYSGGYYGDPWYGWYDNYYYPGFGIYIYDQHRRPHRWNDNHRRFWEGRRSRWRDRDWNDRRWERWDGWDRDGSGDGRRWRDRDRDGDDGRRWRDRDGNDGRRWRNRDRDGDGRRWRDRRGDAGQSVPSAQSFRAERAEPPARQQQPSSEARTQRRESGQSSRQIRSESRRHDD